jgi:hypothetical protein
MEELGKGKKRKGREKRKGQEGAPGHVYQEAERTDGPHCVGDPGSLGRHHAGQPPVSQRTKFQQSQAALGRRECPSLKVPKKKTGGVAQVLECLLCKHKALSSNPSPTKKEGRERGREEGRKSQRS